MPNNSPSSLRALLRAFLMISWTLFVLPFVFLTWVARLDRTRARIIQCFYIVALRVLAVRVTVIGALSAERPLLLVGNHLSYVDVFVLGARAPISFTPKKEVRRWPVIGFLCVMADCIFVERKPSEITQAKEQMERRLDKDKIVCLFPEGTTSDGRDVLRFKSGFFSLAEEYDMPVQPVTTRYTHIGNEAITDARRAEVAWVGEATFFGHVRRLLALPSISATITLHPLLSLQHYEDRKALAKAAEEMIRAEVAHAR